MQIGTSGLTFGNGTLAQVVSDASMVRRQLDALTRQAGDGLISDNLAGLGVGAAASLSLGSSLDEVKTWQTNAQAAAGPMQTAQSALAGISDIASHFFAETAALNGVSATAIDATAASARDALTQMADLLNSKFGDRYVFAGTDSANPPIPGNILSSGMVTGIAATVGALATSGAAGTIAATLAVAMSNVPGISPFSLSLSQPAAALQSARTMVATGSGAPTPTGMLAGTNGDVVSTGATTTGSYIRDVMRALATIGALSGTQATAPGLGALVQDIHTSLGDAISALNGDAGVMGNRQAALGARQQSLGDLAAVVQGQIANVQDVDMAATLSRLTATQTQLQASYNLLGTLRSMSLASVLAGGG